MDKVQSSLLLSRINAPKPPDHLYSRDRLINKLRSNTDKKLIFIASPAGYGKTTLVLDYLKRTNLEHAWINITESLNHPYSFFYTFIYALKSINNSFGNDSLKMLDSVFEKNRLNEKNLKQSVSDLSKTIGIECSAFFVNKLAVVLDDYHHIEDMDDRDMIIDTIVKNMPSNIQVIITSRQLPEMDFIYYMRNDLMLKLEMEQLMFTEEESGGMLAEKYKINNPEKIMELNKNLGGWVTGLHLVSQGFGDELDSINISHQPIPENIFNFLSEKTFSRLDEETRNLLLYTSVIDNFHRDLCEYIGITGFEKIISYLILNHSFVQVIPIIYPDGKKIVSYNYQILFRNYLRSKLRELKTEKEINDIYLNAGRYFAETGDTAASIDYMLKGGEYEKSMELINKNFDSYFKDGKIEFLWNWYKAIPKSITASSPGSVINIAILKKFYSGDLEGAMQGFEEVLKSPNNIDDKFILYKAVVNRTLLLINKGRAFDAVNDIMKWIEGSDLTEYRLKLKYYRAFALFSLSEYNSAENLLNEINDGFDERLMQMRSKLLGHIYLIKGDYNKALHFYKNALENEYNMLDKFEICCNLTMLCSQTADSINADKYRRDLEDFIKRFPAGILKVPYSLALQSYYFEKGEFNKAIEILRSLYYDADTMKHKQLQYLTSRLLTEYYYYNSEIPEASNYLERSDNFADKNNVLKSIEKNVSKALIIELTDEEKVKLLLDASKYYKENNLHYNYMQVCFYLAKFYFKKNDFSASSNYLAISIDIAERKGYNSFIKREYRFDSSIFECLKDSDYIKKVLTP